LLFTEGGFGVAAEFVSQGAGGVQRRADIVERRQVDNQARRPLTVA
jgi:hypothetical protein